MLGKLAVHYYRPDFTEGQAKSLIVDMLEDLAEFSVHDVEAAIRIYRQTPPAPGRAKYFPDSGTLRKLASEERKDRSDRANASASPGFKPQFGESRPIMWWCQPKRFWQPNWRESDIPEDHRDAYHKAQKKAAAK